MFVAVAPALSQLLFVVLHKVTEGADASVPTPGARSSIKPQCLLEPEGKLMSTCALPRKAASAGSVIVVLTVCGA